MDYDTSNPEHHGRSRTWRADKCDFIIRESHEIVGKARRSPNAVAVLSILLIQGLFSVFKSLRASSSASPLTLAQMHPAAPVYAHSGCGVFTVGKSPGWTQNKNVISISPLSRNA